MSKAIQDEVKAATKAATKPIALREISNGVAKLNVQEKPAEVKLAAATLEAAPAPSPAPSSPAENISYEEALKRKAERELEEAKVRTRSSGAV